jgi:secreted trypsin-like serine protease
VQVNIIVLLSHYSHFKGNNLYFCCAFCYISDAANDIYIGRHSRQSGVNDSSERIDIEEKVLNPSYRSWSYGNDLMIMKLKDKSTKPYIKLSPNSPDDGQELTVIGFGDTSAGSGLVIPTKLQEVQLNYLPNEECQDMIGHYTIADDMMCALEIDKDSWYVLFSSSKSEYSKG